MKFHDRQSSERCIRKLISRHCLEKTCTRWNDFLFLITDDLDFRPQTCTNSLVFRECKHIKNIFEDVYFTKNLFHITLIHTLDHNMFIHWVITYTKFPQITDLTLIHTLDHNMLIHQGNYLHQGSSYNKPDLNTYT